MERAVPCAFLDNHGVIGCYRLHQIERAAIGTRAEATICLRASPWRHHRNPVTFPSFEHVRRSAEAALRINRAQLIDKYEAFEPREGLTMEEESRILDTDKAKEVFPFFPESSESRARYGIAVYASAVELIEQLYERRLDTGNAGDMVTFTGGGPGSGKSSLVNSLASTLAANQSLPWVIVDGTMADAVRVRRKIALATSRRLDVSVWFLFRDFEAAVRGFIERAINIGRAVPLQRVAEKHWNSWSTLLDLLDDGAVDADAVSLFEMAEAIEGKRAFVLGSVNLLRKRRAETTLEQMIDLAYKTLESMSTWTPGYLYEHLAER